MPQTVQELNEAKQKLRDRAVAEIERVFLIGALRRNAYSVTRAAAETGMQRSNFQAMLGKHGLRIKDILQREGSAADARETPAEDSSSPDGNGE